MLRNANDAISELLRPVNYFSKNEVSDAHRPPANSGREEEGREKGRRGEENGRRGGKGGRLATELRHVAVEQISRKSAKVTHVDKAFSYGLYYRVLNGGRWPQGG